MNFLKLETNQAYQMNNSKLCKHLFAMSIDIE